VQIYVLFTIAWFVFLQVALAAVFAFDYGVVMICF